MNSNIEIKIDYFSATFPLDVDADESVIFKVHEMVFLMATYLNIKNFEVLKSKFAQNNYNYQFQLGEFIILRLDGPMNDSYQRTCHLELKGEGCRDFERRNPDKTWINFLLFMAELNCKYKRIDIAIDDFEGTNVKLGWLLEKINKKQYTSVFRSPCQIHGSMEGGLTLQFGTHDSPIELCIYDKLQEQKKRRKKCDKNYWIRYEMRFRGEKADRIIFALLSRYKKENEDNDNVGFDLQKFSFEQLYRILDIKEDNNYDVKSQHKVKTDLNWTSFLDNVEKGELPKLELVQDETLEKYLKAARPYISLWLYFKYLMLNRDPYLFEMEIYKFMAEEAVFSKQRFQRLNIYLNQLHLKTLDDAEIEILKEEFKGIYEERSLPF